MSGFWQREALQLLRVGADGTGTDGGAGSSRNFCCVFGYDYMCCGRDLFESSKRTNNAGVRMILGSMAFMNDIQPLNYPPFIAGPAAASFGSSPGAIAGSIAGSIPGAALDLSLGVFPVGAPRANS